MYCNMILNNVGVQHIFWPYSPIIQFPIEPCSGVDDLDNFLALKSYAINEGHKEIS